MAKYTPGPTVAAISGSIGGSVFSRNRYGQYIRFRAIPTVSTTPYALATKAKLQDCSSAWQSLTAAQKLAWRVWAAQNPVQDSLGFAQIITGHVAYVGLNTRRLRMGQAQIVDPPITPRPQPLTSLTMHGDIGPGAIDLAFLATPLGAQECLYMWFCVQTSSGVNYVENYLRCCDVSGVAQASPYDFKANVENRFGALVVDQIVHAKVCVIDKLSGQISAYLRAHVVVTDTT